MARARGSVSSSHVPDITLIEIDGLPYAGAEWLERRIYRDSARAKRWRQEAQRVAKRTDPDGIATHAAYLWQSLAMSYRVAKWRRSLALTQAAIVNRQRTARVEFGLLVQDRRLAAVMERPELAARARLDRKTILNIETASFAPSVRAMRAIVSVSELYLTWTDVSPALLEANPADGRKNRTARRKTKKRKKNNPRRCPGKLGRSPPEAIVCP